MDGMDLPTVWDEHFPSIKYIRHTVSYYLTIVLFHPSDLQIGTCNIGFNETTEHGRKCNNLFTQVQARNPLWNEREFL
jgi:hypothetical protein